MSTRPESTQGLEPVTDQTADNDFTGDRSWFWTEERQQGLRQALEDFEQGRCKEFDNVEDLIRELKS